MPQTSRCAAFANRREHHPSVADRKVEVAEEARAWSEGEPPTVTNSYTTPISQERRRSLRRRERRVSAFA
jgi:CRISPR/Cas system-associated exonuclease Cas4 (RecB family)